MNITENRSLLTERHSDKPQHVQQDGDNADRRITKVMVWYLEHMSESPTIDDAAATINLCSGHLQRIFHRGKGCSVHEAFNEVRLANAKALLVNSMMSAAEVGQMCGFSKPSSFGRFFKGNVGTSPCSWRSRARSANRLRYTNSANRLRNAPVARHEGVIA